MHVLKERYVKKSGKDICESELYILLKTQYFFTMYMNRNRQFISHVEIYMICWFLDIIAINYNKIPDLVGLHGNITVNLFC
jgi:hypothetical protein